MKNIELTAQDGWKLNADFYPSESDRAVILLHQFRRDKSDVRFLAEKLNQENFNVLAVDLRGHGQSQGKYENFTEADFQNMFYDALAAEEYLHELNPKMKIQIVGASIGANTALRFQEMNSVESAVMLSPGLNYHGIDPIDANLSNIACPVYYLVSEDDGCLADTKQLYESSGVSDELKKISIYSGKAHGVDILRENSQALEDVVAWLKAR